MCSVVSAPQDPCDPRCLRSSPSLGSSSCGPRSFLSSDRFAGYSQEGVSFSAFSKFVGLVGYPPSQATSPRRAGLGPPRSLLYSRPLPHLSGAPATPREQGWMDPRTNEPGNAVQDLCRAG